MHGVRMLQVLSWSWAELKEVPAQGSSGAVSWACGSPPGATPRAFPGMSTITQGSQYLGLGSSLNSQAQKLWIPPS